MKGIFQLIFFLASINLFAQQYNFQYYSVAEGLAQSQVYSMIEDHHGHLWFGTNGGGLNRFDGLDFEVFTVKNGLINNVVDALYETKGKLYVGAKNGMSVYDGRQFKNYFVTKEANVRISAFQFYQNKLLVGTSLGVYEFDGESFKYSSEFNHSKAVQIRDFFVDSKEQLWIGTRRGAWKYDGQNLIAFQAKDGLTNGEVNDICEAPDGQIWLSTFNGVYVYDENAFTPVSENEGVRSKYLNAVFCDQNGKVWLGTQDKGISIYNPTDSTIMQLDDKSGLCNNNVQNIFQDSWGGVWIGTSGGGVCKYAGQQFQHYNISDRPGDNLVYALVKDSAGTMWFSAADDGVVRLDSAGFQWFNRQNGFSNTKTKAMLSDSKGRLWLGTNDNGVAYFNGKNFEFLKYKNRPLAPFTKDFVEDANGAIWVASSAQGVYKITPKDSIATIQEFFQTTFLEGDSLRMVLDSLPRDSVIFTYKIKKIPALNFSINALHFDQLGRLWFASAIYGVGYLNGAEAITFGKESGMPSTNVRSIIEDENGHLWIGTAGYGIARMNLYSDSLDVQVFNESNGLSSGNVYLLELDEQGMLWVGCGRGVDQVELDEVQNIKSVKSFGKADGFLGAETCQNAVYKDASGSVWFGTIDGATKYLPGLNSKNTVPPKLHIRSVELNNKAFEKSEFGEWITSDNVFKPNLELPYQENDLSFEFHGVNLANPQKVEYQWKLEGRDEEWSNRSKKNSVNYTNLPSGNYEFKVRAYNEDLVFNKEPLTTAFIIQTPFWQEPWFWILCGVSFLTIIGLIFRYRVNQIRKKAKVERERLEMENNLLQLEQKALQLQMNPHFIFNALNTVQSLFMSNEQGAARTLLSKFAKLMRSILENSRAANIPLQKEVDLLDNYLAIEQFSRPNTFLYEIKVDESLDADEINIPPMLIQPFVENAIIHGVVPLKKEGLIQLHFQKSGEQLLCSIKDNGIGRTAAAKLRAQNARKHKSVALEVTKDRLAFLNDSNGSDKGLVVKDLMSDDGSVAGTEVLVRLPLEEW